MSAKRLLPSVNVRSIRVALREGKRIKTLLPSALISIVPAREVILRSAKMSMGANRPLFSVWFIIIHLKYGKSPSILIEGTYSSNDSVIGVPCSDLNYSV